MEEGREDEDLTLAYLLPWLTCFSGWYDLGFSGNACWSWVLGQWNESGGRLEEKICVVCLRWGQRRREGHSRCLLQSWHETGGLDLEGRWERRRSAPHPVFNAYFRAVGRPTV